MGNSSWSPNSMQKYATLGGMNDEGGARGAAPVARYQRVETEARRPAGSAPRRPPPAPGLREDQAVALLLLQRDGAARTLVAAAERDGQVRVVEAAHVDAVAVGPEPDAALLLRGDRAVGQAVGEGSDRIPEHGPAAHLHPVLGRDVRAEQL